MARRNIGQPFAYAWIITEEGRIRCIPLAAGLSNRVVEYDANDAPADAFDTGQYNWRIASRERDKPNPPMALIDAYAQDEREEFAKLVEPAGPRREVPPFWREKHGGKVPQGYDWYMRYVDDCSSGRQERVEQKPGPMVSPGRDQNGVPIRGDVLSTKTSSKRPTMRPYPEDGYPSIAIRRMHGAGPSFKLPKFQPLKRASGE